TPTGPTCARRGSCCYRALGRSRRRSSWKGFRSLGRSGGSRCLRSGTLSGRDGGGQQNDAMTPQRAKTSPGSTAGSFATHTRAEGTSELARDRSVADIVELLRPDLELLAEYDRGELA